MGLGVRVGARGWGESPTCSAWREAAGREVASTAPRRARPRCRSSTGFFCATCATCAGRTHTRRTWSGRGVGARVRAREFANPNPNPHPPHRVGLARHDARHPRRALAALAPALAALAAFAALGRLGWPA